MWNLILYDMQFVAYTNWCWQSEALAWAHFTKSLWDHDKETLDARVNYDYIVLLRHFIAYVMAAEHDLVGSVFVLCEKLLQDLSCELIDFLWNGFPM